MGRTQVLTEICISEDFTKINPLLYILFRLHKFQAYQNTLAIFVQTAQRHPVDVGQGGAAEEVRAILMGLRGCSPRMVFCKNQISGGAHHHYKAFQGYIQVQEMLLGDLYVKNNKNRFASSNG